MEINLYPEHLFTEDKDEKESITKQRLKDNNESVAKFLLDLMKTHTDLWSRVYTTLKKAESSENFDLLERQEIVASLKNIKEPLWEFRIPKQRRGGVVRLYFAYYQGKSSNKIYILSAELKHGSKADNNIINQAKERYYKVCI